MKTVTYTFADGIARTIEVEDEFAVMYDNMEKEYRRAEERYRWTCRKRLVSLDSILDAGGQIADENTDFTETDYRFETLYNAIVRLNPAQQYLLQEVFFNGRTNCSLAEELRISETAVRHRLAVIYKKIRSFLT